VSTAEKWILGEPLLKQYFSQINVIEQSITFHTVELIEFIVIGSFDTAFGWLVLGGILVCCAIVYFLAIRVFSSVRSCFQERFEVEAIRKRYTNLYEKYRSNSSTLESTQ
jgi:hypothetical protein